MIKKIFIDANTLLLYSFSLARQIYESNFAPTLLIGIWRGGAPPGVAIHEFLTLKGLDLDHTVIKAHSYKGIEQYGKVHIEGLDYILSHVHPEDRILIVDDIFDTGRTLKALIDSIQEKFKEGRPRIKTATIFYKPAKNQTSLVPDYYFKVVNQWVTFPHELKDLTREEIRQKGEELYRIIFE